MFVNTRARCEISLPEFYKIIPWQSNLTKIGVNIRFQGVCFNIYIMYFISTPSVARGAYKKESKEDFESE